MSTATTEMPQHLQAHAYANKVRLAHAVFCRELRVYPLHEGMAMLATYIEDVDNLPEEIDRLGVLKALKSVQRVGPDYAERIMKAACITRRMDRRSDPKQRPRPLRIGGLTERERESLVAALRHLAQRAAPKEVAVA